MAELLYEEESYRILGACFEVYNEKGNGFLEPVYQECIEIELAFQKIPFAAHEQFELTYREVKLKQRFIPDFVCFGKIILELKAVERLIDAHYAQVINYLNATGLQLGLLVNFGAHPKLEWKRLINNNK